MNFSPFVKQLFVAGSPLLAGLSVGGAVSYPTVLLHQLKRNDTTIPLDFDTASWIGAIHGLAGIPSILVPTLMEWRGRKFAFILACLVSIIGWILAYTATSAPILLASESFHGLGSNSIYAVTCLSISEMMSPEYRDSFIQLYYILESVTMALNGLLTQYLHWKTISIIMCVPMILALIIACMWPESPYWLACKGKFNKCEKAFTWLRGNDEHSKKELKALINAQKENMNSKKRDKNNSFKHFWQKITRRDFYVPIAHIFVLEYLVQGIGCIIILIYSIELFQKASGNQDIAFFGGFIVNTIQLLGVAVTIVLNRYLNKKTVLLFSIFGATVSLICASMVSYFQEIGYVANDSMLCLYCLIVYMIAISLGVIPVAYPVASALMPVKHRGVGGVIYVTNTCLLHTIALKFAPYSFKHLGLWGTFLVFAVNGVCCGLLIWKYVPETKGRSLQEIEDYYIFGRFADNHVIDDGVRELMIRSNAGCEQDSNCVIDNPEFDDRNTENFRCATNIVDHKLPNKYVTY